MPMPIPPKSKEEVVQEFRIQSIRDATMRVIGRKGISAATMQDIADEAGVAKGTLYLYFRDRDELVEKTFENALTELHRRIDVQIEANTGFETRFRAAVRTILEFFRENREFFRLYTAHRVPEGTPQQQRKQRRQCDHYRERVERFAGFLKSAMDGGEIRKLDPYRVANFIIEGVNSIVIERVMDEKSSTSIEADVDLITSLVCDGIRVPRSQG
jgi:AcrR family transcriptional regulator